MHTENSGEWGDEPETEYWPLPDLEHPYQTPPDAADTHQVPAYVPPQQWAVPQPYWAAPVGPQRSSPLPLVFGSAAAIVVLVAAGGAVAYLAAQSGGGSTRIAAEDSRVLRGSFPSVPSAEWELTLSDVEFAADVQFDDDVQFGFAQDYGDTLVTSVGSYTATDETLLVAVDAKSGDIRWTAPTEGHESYQCAEALADGLLLCAREIDPDASSPPIELREYRMSDGELVDTITVDGMQNVAVANDSVYTAGWDSDSDNGWIAKGTPGELDAEWKQEYDFGSCGQPGYGGYLYVEDDVAVYSYVAAAASDGRQLNPDRTAVTNVSAHGIVVADCATFDGDGPHDLELLDFNGNTKWTGTFDTPWPATDLTPGRRSRPFVIGNGARDPRTGSELWSTTEDVSFTWIDGDVIYGEDTFGNDDYEDDVSVAYSLSSGDRLWEGDAINFWPFTDGSRIITTVGDPLDRVAAYDLETGKRTWVIDVDDAPEIAKAGRGFATVAADRITFYPPTE